MSLKAVSCSPTALAGTHMDVFAFILNLYLSAPSWLQVVLSSCFETFSLRPHCSSSSPPDQYIDVNWVNDCEAPMSEKFPLLSQNCIFSFHILHSQSELLI